MSSCRSSVDEGLATEASDGCLDSLDLSSFLVGDTHASFCLKSGVFLEVLLGLLKREQLSLVGGELRSDEGFLGRLKECRSLRSKRAGGVVDGGFGRSWQVGEDE